MNHDTGSGRYIAYLDLPERGRVHLGRWPTPQQAAGARDRYMLHVGLPESWLQRPRDSLQAGPASLDELRRLAKLASGRTQTSEFAGVSRYRTGFAAELTLAGKRYHVAGIKDENEAAHIRDRMALYYFGPEARLNLPDSAGAPSSVETIREERSRATKSQTTSRYRGVHRVRRGGPDWAWHAMITCQGEHRYLGSWPTEAEAAIAYDRAARHLLGAKAALNFPDQNHPPTPPAALAAETTARLKAQAVSRFRGVRRCGSGWAALITVRGHQHYLGFRATEEEAARAYDEAAVRLGASRAKLNFPPAPESVSSNADSSARVRVLPVREGIVRRRRA